MPPTIYDRNKLLWGEENQSLLFKKHVIVFGLGGVGSYSAEALARAGIGRITVVDFDEVSETDINRQLYALGSTKGQRKTVLAEKRIKDINSDIKVNAVNDFCTADLTEKLFSEPPDYVIDAVDTMKSKIDLIESCIKKGIPVISCAATGNRLDPELLYTADISEVNPGKCVFTKNLVAVLKKRGITSGLTIVASTEPPVSREKKFSEVKLITKSGKDIEFNKISPGSSPFVPPVAGFIMAGYVVRSFIKLQ